MNGASTRGSGGGADGDDAAPSMALSDVWVLLDELPRGTASPALTGTTIEMAAVGLDAAAGATAPRAGLRRWLVPGAVVAAALVAGALIGRVTAPDPDRTLVEQLPFVRHLDLLREAGSVGFLEEVAGRGGPPLRMVLRPGPEAARKDAAEFTAVLDSLRRMQRADPAERREILAELPVEERAEVERALRDFAALSAAERRTYAAVAEALVDPARPEIRSAATDWHRWLAVVRPEDRADIVASSADKRLEWIDWYAARVEGRGRPGPPDRPPGARWPPGGEGPRPDRFRRPPRGEGSEPPGPPPREGPPRGAPPPFRPDRPAPPPETRAPPG